MEEGIRILISYFPQEAVSYGSEFCVQPSSWKIVLNMFASELEELKRRGEKEVHNHFK